MWEHGRVRFDPDHMFSLRNLKLHPIELYKAIERRRQVNDKQLLTGRHPAVDVVWKKTLRRLDERLKDKTFRHAVNLFGEGWHMFATPVEWAKAIEMCAKEAVEMHQEEIALIKQYHPNVLELKP